MVWLPMFGIFNVRTDADACDCTRGLYGHRERVCTESWLWEKKPMPHLGLEPTSVLRLTFQSDALPTELFPTLCFVLAAVVVFVFLPLSLFPCSRVSDNTTAPRAWVLVSGYWALKVYGDQHPMVVSTVVVYWCCEPRCYILRSHPN